VQRRGTLECTPAAPLTGGQWSRVGRSPSGTAGWFAPRVPLGAAPLHPQRACSGQMKRSHPGHTHGRMDIRNVSGICGESRGVCVCVRGGLCGSGAQGGSVATRAQTSPHPHEQGHTCIHTRANLRAPRSPGAAMTPVHAAHPATLKSEEAPARMATDRKRATARHTVLSCRAQSGKREPTNRHTNTLTQGRVRATQRNMQT
jgi:hypothetical protein